MPTRWSDRRFWMLVAGLWLATSVMLTIATSGKIASWTFPDPDDQLRLLQVRAWLAGQSWFDVTQYRINLPAGAPMHWSRIIDPPIALVILVASRFVDAHSAETVALVAIPLLTLAATIAAAASFARKLLGDDERAIFAACLVPIGVEVMHQLRPMRIDHHGWQLVLALVVARALLGREPRHGVIAGGACAVWLTISVEGLPFVAAALALAALRWAYDPRERKVLCAMVTCAAVATLALFMLTHRSDAWTQPWCDAVSPVWLAMLAIGAAGVVAVTSIDLRLVPARLGGLVVVAVATLAVLPLAAPQCLAGPFASLDPLVRDFWYVNTLEGLPVWRQDAVTIVNVLGLPLVGLVGTGVALRSGHDRRAWCGVLCLLLAAIASAIMVERAGGVANLIALPGASLLVGRLLVRARRVTVAPLRLIATLAAILVAAPGITAGMIESAVSPSSAEPTTPARGSPDPKLCNSGDDMARLDQLPAHSNILAPLDISPSILMRTDHVVVASGHHRNAAAMHDVIAAFAGSADTAHAIVRRRRIAYIAVCDGMFEIDLLNEHFPHGFWSRLAHGQRFGWLVPVTIAGSPIKVWRVVG